jgi:uncharacterized membrane protein
MIVFLHFAAAASPQAAISFPSDAITNEEIVLRWVHFVAGFTWLGLLYFFNLVGFQTMSELKPATKLEVYPRLMARAMLWFRWSALLTVLAGVRYYMIVLAADAHNAGDAGLQWRWLGEWFAVWLGAWLLLYPLQMPWRGAFANGWLRAGPIAVVVIGAACLVLRLNASPQSSNSHLAISVGGGLGLLILLNAWGIVWRAQKRLIAWHRAAAEEGVPFPPDAARLSRWSFLAARTAFWISLPMLFLMGAAEHYPFLGSLGK